MADLRERAALAAVKRTLKDLTLSPEEKAQRRRKSLIKYAVIGVLGVAAVLALMSVLASLWMYALGLLVVGGLAAGAYLYARPKVQALKARAAARFADKAATDAVMAKQHRLEDELAALKKKGL